MIFHHQEKSFLFGELSSEKKKTLATLQAFLLLCKKARQTKCFPIDDEKLSASAICKPHTQEKSQDTATFTEDAITNTEHTSELETSFVCT
jgi:hypothetical protein